MYGARYVKNLRGQNAAPMVDVQVTASTTITKGDLVNIAAGYLDLAGAGERIFGIAEGTVVQTASSTYKCPVTPLCEGDVIRMDNDNTGTTFGVTHPGTYFDVTGATGALVVDTSTTSATAGQLLCLNYGVDPTDLSVGDYVVAESQFKAYTQA
jgi:hypothetical protein